MTDWPPKTLGSCYPPCTDRLMAIVHNEFGPAKSLGGWVFRDGPYRAKTWRATYYHPDVMDHTGEPVVFVSCPWCGGELAPPPDDEGLETDDGC